jgi:hypothetical protein
MRITWSGAWDASDEATEMSIETNPSGTGFSMTAKYKWICHGKHPCKHCEGYHGIVKTMEAWLMGGILPGFHKHCQCSLVRVDEKISSDQSDPITPQEVLKNTNWGGAWDALDTTLANDNAQPPEDNSWAWDR